MHQIRQARPDDAVAIAHVHITSRRVAMPWLPNLHDEAETVWWVEHVVLPGQVVWVAEIDGSVVGVAALDGPMLEHLYVLPDHQGKGVGSALLARAMEHANGPLRLWSFQRNTLARTFYERKGFREIEFTNGDGNEEREPDVLYEYPAGIGGKEYAAHVPFMASMKEHAMQLKLIEKSLLIDNVWAFVFEPEEPQDYTAGEYVRVQLDHENADDEGPKRFFTNSAPPYQGVVQITTRVTGSTFKQALAKLPVGDASLTMIKPHEGDFVWQDSDKPIIFVAAGIGVTPYYSIAMQRVHEGKPIPATLLYSGRNGLLPWRPEFAALEESNPEFRVDYQIGEHVSAENLQKRFPDLNASIVYLSGPEQMVEDVGEQLKAHGLPESQLKQDWFPNYDASSY